MGGKGGSGGGGPESIQRYGPNEADTAIADLGGMLGAMMSQNQEAMMAYMEQMQQMQTPVTNFDLPEIIKPTEIDWTEEASKIANKSKADEALRSKQKKGRLDTILTSPLGDEEENLETVQGRLGT